MKNIDVAYYDRRWSKEDQQPVPPSPMRVRLIRDTVEALCKKGNIKSAVDVGCGNGWILEALAEHNKELNLFGVEPSSVGAANSRLRVPSATIETGTLGTSSLKGPYDIAVSSEVIEHVTSQEQYLEEIANAINPGGYLVLTTPNGKFRKNYFANVNAEPQPVEKWLTANAVQALADPWFVTLSKRTFDLNYYLQSNNILRSIRSSANSAPGGRYVRRVIDAFLNRYWGAGLYILFVLQKRSVG